MPDEPKTNPPNDATLHISSARTRLEALREELKGHPELERAIEDLERALNVLTMKTGGLL